jgi:exopolysaccharide biosynthesis polyprenyl glycosylphosphotransferase
MNSTSGITHKYWVAVLRHFVLDVLLMVAAFLVAFRLRFTEPGEWFLKLGDCWPGVILGALVFAVAAYIFGLYSSHTHDHSFARRAFFLGICFAIAQLMMADLFSVNFSTRIGRGAMAIAYAFAYLTVLLHHGFLLHQFRNYRERVALIVTSREDEAEALLLQSFGGSYLDLAGIVRHTDYQPAGNFRVLGEVNDLPEIARRENLERVLCTNQSILDPTLCRKYCELRYSGVMVTPLIGLFEEICQCVPTELITPEWLMSASGAPEVIYIKKFKRAFDIIVSIFGIIFFSPFLLAGMLLVKIASPNGPVIFRQSRLGRFGKTFTLYKLRTMRVDAEDDTPIWAQAKDPRAIPGGNILRRYRIDEIPQLWNVLSGEMSFVGPRPERPEFVQSLSAEILYYQERLLVQPGITGWAQVNYPYGASVEDARRKLEYDLYYTKNMSLFLDVFILLDTIRIILGGGLKKPVRVAAPRYTSETKTTAVINPTTVASGKPLVSRF